jgi:hypothetical protein
MPAENERLEELKMIYESFHGAIHEALFNFPPEIQVLLVEMALKGELDIRARRVPTSEDASDLTADQLRRLV